MSRPSRASLVLAPLVLALAACTASAAPPSSGAPSVAPDAVLVTAKDNRFAPEAVTVPAGEAFSIAFDNRDAVPHNVALVAEDGSQPFSGEVFTGPRVVTEPVPALPAGSYRIICVVHPDMAATLTAE